MTERQTRTLMLVGAHHDDNELMAGLIAKHVKNGWRVVSVVATDGRFVAGEANDANIAIREAESVAAAKLLNTEPVFLHFSEGGLRADEALCLALTRQIRTCQPNVVVTHPPKDYHLDHEATSQGTCEAVRRCGNVTYDDTTERCRIVPTLYYCDSWFTPFEPDLFVDVSGYMDIKAAALAAHTSQLPTDPDDPNSMIALERERARYRGIQAMTDYAEAYQRVVLAGLRQVTDLLEQ